MCAGGVMRHIRSSHKKVLASDDWYPTKDGSVTGYVSLLDLSEQPSKKYPKRNLSLFAVTIRFLGHDDFGLTKEFLYSSRETALQKYRNLNRWLSGLGVVTKWTLMSVGFGPV